MKKALLFFTIVLLVQYHSISQQNKNVSQWRATILRKDGNNIVFNFSLQQKGKQSLLYVENGAERLRVDSVRFAKDSVFIKMPFFESELKAKVTKDKWNGVWVKGTADAEQLQPFAAERSSVRFKLTDGPAKTNVNGRWALKFSNDTTKEGASVAEFWHRGNRVTGSVLTPTGDYRFLEGVVTGNKLKISAFDGSHAVLFTADITDKKTLANGRYYSGLKFTDTWSSVKNAKATVKQDLSAMYLKPGEERLNFRFNDLEGNPVSINDDRFKNKVVIVQLMGSWCPNCMDETQFLSDYYKKNKQRGIEIVALAYEYTTDVERSTASLRKFQKRFDVEYPILITPVTVSDSLRTEKTLPQVTSIKVFPSSIILDKKGKVRKFDNSFYGPGTGEHFEAYKRDFYETMDNLLKEE